jgi:hypothetical protein
MSTLMSTVTFATTDDTMFANKTFENAFQLRSGFSPTLTEQERDNLTTNYEIYIYNSGKLWNKQALLVFELEIR